MEVPLGRIFVGCLFLFVPSDAGRAHPWPWLGALGGMLGALREYATLSLAKTHAGRGVGAKNTPDYQTKPIWD
jgi:hypothetical protein